MFTQYQPIAFRGRTEYFCHRIALTETRLTETHRFPPHCLPDIVLSAFLLFQVQPLIAKLILPWFGGSAAVWTSCMLFFQMALLAAMHTPLAEWTGPLAQTWIHAGMLTISLLSLPILPAVRWKPAGGRIRCWHFGAADGDGRPAYFCCPPPARCCNPGIREPTAVLCRGGFLRFRMPDRW